MGKRVITNEVLQQYQEHLCLEERSRGTVDKYSREIQGLAAWLAGAELTRMERTAAAKATKTRNHQRQTCSHMQFTKVYGLAGLSG